MRFAFSDEQLQFQRSVREVLARVCTPVDVRKTWEPGAARSQERWRSLTELGVVPALVPESHGGLGMGELDLVLALEETGRSALPEPIVESAGVVAPLLRELGTSSCDAWLGKLATGEIVGTIGLESESFVCDAQFADLLILQRGEELHAIEADATRLRAHRSVDGARRLFTVEWTPTSQSRIATGEPARLAIAAARDRAALGFAAQLLGLARHLVGVSVDYAKVRTQFGQPIGAFQAVKHALADAHLAVEMAAPVVYRAAHSISHSLEDRSQHASMAKARASDAASSAARVALQCHGAIGYSHEHDLHLWMKRAWALSAAWGDAAHHRARIGATLFGTTA
ncbi:MAG: acyl-CoA dehydrogenase family protein [Polyangiales bacterium]